MMRIVQCTPVVLASLLVCGLMTSAVHADHTPNPTSSTLIGDFQNELGCPGDFQADCANTDLTYSGNSDIWQGLFSIPAGSWHYKVALNDNIADNYGLNATFLGPNIPLNLVADTSVRFYYDHKSHWITDDVNSVIASLVGNFQNELGCAVDFDPSCLRAWLQDPDGDGIYRFVTSLLPEGSYDVLVVHDQSFDEFYGADGVRSGVQITFAVPAAASMCFAYDPVSHLLGISSTGSCDVPAAVPEPAAFLLLALGIGVAAPFHRRVRAVDTRENGRNQIL